MAAQGARPRMTLPRALRSERLRLARSPLLVAHLACGLAGGLACGEYFCVARWDPAMSADAYAQFLGALMPLMSGIVCGLAIDEERAAAKSLFLLTMKPILYVANVDEDMLGETFEPIDGMTPIPICAKVEAELSELDPEDAAEYLESLGLERPGLDVLAQAAYKLLGLQSFFTAGEMEVKAWTVRQGATAPQAAGVIHSDFERGFIKAEVISYDDYIELGGEQGARAAGKLRMEGKDYVMADGDVVHFRFNV